MPEPIKKPLERLRDLIDPILIIASLLEMADSVGEETRGRIINTEAMFSAHRELTRVANDLGSVLVALEEIAESSPKREASDA